MSGRKSQQEALRRVNQGLYQKLNDLRAAKDAEIAALKEEVAEANASALNAQQIAIKKMNEATRLRAEIQRLRRFVERVANDAEEIVYFEEGRSMFDGEMRRYIDYSLLKGMANDALLTPEDGKPLEAPALGTTPEDLKRGLLHAQSLSRTGTFPAPVEWQDISQVKQQRPPIKDDDLVNLHCLDDMPDICVWMAKRGHLWYIASDFFKISTF